MGALKLLATPDGRVRAGKAARPAAGSGRRDRSVRGDADRRERVHLRGSVQAAGEPGVGRGGAGDVAGCGDVAGGGVGGGDGRRQPVNQQLKQPSP